MGLSFALVWVFLLNLCASAQEVDAEVLNAALSENRVTTIAMAEVWIQPMQRVTAEVTALNHAQISAQANGEVLKIGVEVG